MVAGASEGVGAELAEALAMRGLNVVLVARRLEVLDQLAAGIATRTGVETRVVAVDLTGVDAADRVGAAVADLEIGFLAYCAGADAAYQPFLAQEVKFAVDMVQRNCVVLMQLCHLLARPMVERGRGGIVIFGSGAGLVGASNMAAYAGSKAFDLVFAEALWSELKPRGVDVLGLVLGQTDTPALRRLRDERGIGTPGRAIKGATPAATVAAQALRHIAHGPSRMVGSQMRVGERVLSLLPRNAAVRLANKAGARVMGSQAK